MNANAYAATHDALTNLPNEYLFLDRLKQIIAISERSTNLFALLILVPDNYTNIYNEYGQSFSEQLVQQIAERLQAALREPDTIARRENNSFAILIPQIENEHSVDQLIRRIHKTLAGPFNIDAYTVYMSFSMGKAIYPYQGTNAELLMQHAESELHKIQPEI